MEFQVNKDVVFQEDQALIEKLKDIHIEKYKKRVKPVCIGALSTSEAMTFSDFDGNIVLDNQQDYIIDFGTHCVGFVTFQLSSIGSPPDAPVKFCYQFGERLDEVMRDSDSYIGELSKSWIQEGSETVDILPCDYPLRRRFAFRYLKLQIISTSPKFKVVFNTFVETVSSANEELIQTNFPAESLLAKIDLVSQKTLAQCMQDVFEDGPKRDRRLWLGDLRLQARANYATFKRNELVKKCLYLFAAKRKDDGQVSANVFIEPHLIPDDTFLMDYSLFFIDTLLEYVKSNKDYEVLEDLYEVAKDQAMISRAYLDEKGEVHSPSGWWAFIDWNEELDKSLAIQGIFIYSYKKMAELALLKNDSEAAVIFTNEAKLMEDWVLKHAYSKDTQLFLTVKNKQISFPSQSWLVLAGVGDEQLRKNVMLSLLSSETSDVVECNTPYMYHHFVEALFEVGLKKEAIQTIERYWGGMIEQGADTFWEAFNPQKTWFSPYGDSLIDSYCHAWSCTPCYLFRKYN